MNINKFILFYFIETLQQKYNTNRFQDLAVDINSCFDSDNNCNDDNNDDIERQPLNIVSTEWV